MIVRTFRYDFLDSSDDLCASCANVPPAGFTSPELADSVGDEHDGDCDGCGFERWQARLEKEGLA